jgi:AcrR family transcriptional regulator
LAAPPAPTPRRLEGEEIVNAVVTATIELDDPEASVNAIADRAGVGVASLYRYFPSKPAIYAEISRRVQAEFAAGIRAVLADPSHDLRSAIAACCRVAIAVPASPTLRRHLHLAVPGAWIYPELAAGVRDLVAEMTAWLEPRLRAPPPDLAARIFVGFAAARGAIQLAALVPALRPSDDELVELITRGALAYLDLPTRAP